MENPSPEHPNPRRLMVRTLIKAGFSDEAIAREMGISDRTVRRYGQGLRRRIYALQAAGYEPERARR
jgi:DNA-binding NarL/FixJ family response regulator